MLLLVIALAILIAAVPELVARGLAALALLGAGAYIARLIDFSVQIDFHGAIEIGSWVWRF